MLFLINFSVLSSIVPDRSIDSWFSVAWLFSAVVLSFFLGQFLIGRVQLMVDSAANEQQKLVQLSVLWSLPPALMNDNTEQQLLLCQKLTNSARSIQKIQQLSVAMLVLVPVLIMMFIRLPIALFVLALLLAVISCFFQVMIEKKKIKKWEAFTQVHSSQRSALRKILSSFKIKRHFVALDSLFDEWLENDMRALKCRVKVDRLGLLTQQLPDFSSGLVQILSIIGLSFLLVSADSTGSELAIADAFIILHLINTCYQMSPRVAQLFNQLSQVKYDLYSCRKLIAGLRSHKKEPITTPDASVAFHDLKLPYQCVLEQKGLSQISGQQIVHICGESGAGKTTFLHCLLGLQKPVSGKIEVLGVNPHAMDADERCKIFSYVEQKSELLPGSLKDNLNLFASLKVAERDVWHALELVKLDDRVRRLPLGLDTPILDTQASFSTGEQQRIVLAQAILKRSIILVMDEAMSGLPEKMEIEILKNIRPLFQQIFFVSHRAHLQKFADRSIVLSRDVGAV
ncbi:ABC transporter ATP-binding protein [Pelagibaculum spongiae]|nr:ABC transporter ATP-binding protein [Pelagibaculum spongiae]